MSKTAQIRDLVEQGQPTPTSLAACLAMSDELLFTEDMLSAVYRMIEGKLGKVVADVSKPEGRKEIAKVAKSIGGALNKLDVKRREYVRELKARPKQIDDTFLEHFRKPAEALKSKIRAPLDAWEEEQAQIEREVTEALEWLNKPVEAGTSADKIRADLNEAKHFELKDYWLDTQRSAVTDAVLRCVNRLDAALSQAMDAERQAAELERLREVERQAELEQARKAGEEQARREEQERAEQQRIAEIEKRTADLVELGSGTEWLAASEIAARLMIANRTRIDDSWGHRQVEANTIKTDVITLLEDAHTKALIRETAADERRRQQEAAAELEQAETGMQSAIRNGFQGQQQHDADREHQAQVHNEIASDLCMVTDISVYAARAIVRAIVRGRVQHVSINY